MKDVYEGPRHHHESGVMGVGIKLYKNEIRYDVDYALWRMGETSGVTGEKRDIFELGKDDQPWIDRVLTNAIEKMKSTVRWAFKPGVPGADTQVFPSGDEISLLLTVDRDEWRGDASGVATAMHEYMVDSLLYEWSRLNMPDRSADYYQRKTDDLRRVHHQVDTYEIEPPKFWM